VLHIKVRRHVHLVLKEHKTAQFGTIYGKWGERGKEAVFFFCFSILLIEKTGFFVFQGKNLMTTIK